jgi:hypothetical protein
VGYDRSFVPGRFPRERVIPYLGARRCSWDSFDFFCACDARDREPICLFVSRFEKCLEPSQREKSGGGIVVIGVVWLGF